MCVVRAFQGATLVIVSQAMLEAHPGAAALAGVCVDGRQLFSAARCRALGLLVHFGVVAGVAAGRAVPLERDVSVLFGHESNRLRTNWAHDDLRGLAGCLRAGMRRVGAVLQAVHQLAAVAGKWQEIDLATIQVGAMPSYRQQICIVCHI